MANQKRQPSDTRETLGELLEVCGGYNKIARYSGLDPGYVHRVLNGRQGCSLNAASKISIAMGITLDDLNRLIETAKVPAVPAMPVSA